MKILWISDSIIPLTSKGPIPLTSKGPIPLTSKGPKSRDITKSESVKRLKTC